MQCQNVGKCESYFLLGQIERVEFFGELKYGVDHLSTNDLGHQLPRVMNVVWQNQIAFLVDKQRRMLDEEKVEKAVVDERGEVLLIELIETRDFFGEADEGFHLKRYGDEQRVPDFFQSFLGSVQIFDAIVDEPQRPLVEHSDSMVVFYVQLVDLVT